MLRISLLFALSLNACQADETISGQTNPTDIWALTSMDGKPVTTDVTITFPEQGKIAGRAPCNQYGAAQTAPLPWFKLGPIYATKRACPDLALESQYFNALAGITLAEYAKNTLILSTDDGPLLIYKRQ